MTKKERKDIFKTTCEKYGFERINDFTYYIQDNKWEDSWKIIINADNTYFAAFAYLLKFNNRYDTEFVARYIDNGSINETKFLSDMLELCIKRLEGREIE